MPGGRPSIYTDDLAAEICARLVEGSSLRSICRADDMPDVKTVMRWLASNETFRQQYRDAREAQTEALCEDIIEISDVGTNDWMEANDPENPGYRLNGEHIQRSKLRVDTRKWLMSKMSPRKYGDTIKQIQSGDPDNPVRVEVKTGVDWSKYDKPVPDSE